VRATATTTWQPADDISLFDGVLPMLAALKARQHWLAVATGKSRKGLDTCLQAVELRGLFDASRTADETAGKPHPRMLHELMAEFGVEPSRVLMIGDTTHDLQMAVNAGCASVGVSYGAHEPDAFDALGPRFVAHSVPELHDWLLETTPERCHVRLRLPCVPRRTCATAVRPSASMWCTRGRPAALCDPLRGPGACVSEPLHPCPDGDGLPA
jgi:HAD superfamily hydrolase (TIGR01509 family)